MKPEEKQTAKVKQSQSLKHSQEVEELSWEEFAEELSDVQLAAVVGGSCYGSTASSSSTSATTATTTTTKSR